MATEQDHDCTAHLQPSAKYLDAAKDEPMLSATVGDGEVEVYMRCGVCGREPWTVTYEYVSTDPPA